MAISALPVDQRVIDIDSRRFSSIEKALVELITNSDDSYSRLERKGMFVSGNIFIHYERHQNGAVLKVADQAEGMSFDRVRSVLSYGGAHSLMAKGEAGGRGYFGRGLKQAIYGLGHGWIECIQGGRFSRIDLFRGEFGEYLFDDWDRDREAKEKDYDRLKLAMGGNGSQVTIVIENPLTNIPYFSSLLKTLSNNIYLRDILSRRNVEITNMNRPSRKEASTVLHFQEPEAEILIGPDTIGKFIFNNEEFEFSLTLKKSQDTELVLKGDERTSGILVVSGTAVFDCQFFRYENQLGTEFLWGKVICKGLVEMLSKGHPIISDEREGLNVKDSFVTAFAESVSDMISECIKKEQQRLSHVDHATTSRRTQNLIELVLRRMNMVAVKELGIVLPPGPGTGKYGPYNTGRLAVLRFTTPFYYRKVSHDFHVTLVVDRNQLLDQEILTFNFDLPESFSISPSMEAMAVADLPEDGRLEWVLMGTLPGAKGSIRVFAGPYEASCEIVIAEHAAEKGFGLPSKEKSPPWTMDNSVDLFAGYELRNLNNEMERAVYSPKERLILINTEAPTVRLYVNGQGHFKDGARLLLAELLLDVITQELSRFYVDRSMHKGEAEAYHQAKQDMIRRYGVEIHSILMGE